MPTPGKTSPGARAVAVVVSDHVAQSVASTLGLEDEWMALRDAMTRAGAWTQTPSQQV